MYFVPQPLSADTLVSAAVRVVFPWSTCPMVPTFTCGLVRSNLALAIVAESWCPCECLLRPAGRADHCSAGPPVLQARDRDRTGDLILTKDVLYRLSYASDPSFPARAGDGART